MSKTVDKLGRARRKTQGANGPKKLPDKDRAAKSGAFGLKPPAHLGPHGLAWWRWAAQTLTGLGIADKADRRMVELCAETYEDYRNAQEDIATLGRIVAQEVNGSTIYKRNPAFTTMEKARGMLRSFYSDLGLTPSARAKFGGPSEEEDDPFNKIIKLTA